MLRELCNSDVTLYKRGVTALAMLARNTHNKIPQVPSLTAL